MGRTKCKVDYMMEYGRDRTVEVRIQSSSGKEQDKESNQHVKEVKENVSL